jgi:endogenous inhibitor of DNA gyrase (YacG/DUF329 family)
MTCPICRRPTVAEYRPFCSRRCADVDLGCWLTGAYAIPAVDDEAPGESVADPLDNATDAPVEGPSPRRSRR